MKRHCLGAEDCSSYSQCSIRIHPLTQNVTAEIIRFGKITASYDIILGKTILVLDPGLLWTCFVSENEE